MNFDLARESICLSANRTRGIAILFLGVWLQCCQFIDWELALVFSPSNLFEEAAIS
jgi:hypothetical protein